MTIVKSKHKTDPSTMHDLAVKIQRWEDGKVSNVHISMSRFQVMLTFLEFS